MGDKPHSKLPDLRSSPPRHSTPHETPLAVAADRSVIASALALVSQATVAVVR